MKNKESSLVVFLRITVFISTLRKIFVNYGRCNIKTIHTYVYFVILLLHLVKGKVISYLVKPVFLKVLRRSHPFTERISVCRSFTTTVLP